MLLTQKSKEVATVLLMLGAMTFTLVIGSPAYAAPPGIQQDRRNSDHGINTDWLNCVRYTHQSGALAQMLGWQETCRRSGVLRLFVTSTRTPPDVIVVGVQELASPPGEWFTVKPTIATLV
jgi:hypothetical protein